MLHKYSISTSPMTIARVVDVLKTFGVNDLPVPTVGFDPSTPPESQPELPEITIEEVVTNILMMLTMRGADPFNEFFRAITGSDDNFFESPADVSSAVISDFFDKLPSNLQDMLGSIVNELRRLAREEQIAIQMMIRMEQTKKFVNEALTLIDGETLQSRLQEQGLIPPA